ncbi:helix-turn-helix domain-containing protein [Streptomyces goshikiensis]|uniref:helix-turn-helix domain-containing protein n=1 Tax=Streptomyces goshikiensis TaxID=1942 RepID=UPI00167418C5|nr:helix-turn-helix transcriptional regulator [Streptomyces goshikiensis]GHD56038.1 hypothetical protein GCM10010336_00920 [Streptomyces goshikiensis]
MSLKFDPDALRRLREERGLSQGKLSVAVTGDRVRVNAFECGRSTPTLATIGHIADALGVEYTALITRGEVAA